MQTPQFKRNILSAAVAILLLPSITTAAPEQTRVFGKNFPFLISQLPTGTVKAKLESLPRAKRQKAMKWLNSFSFTAHDLKYIKIDNEGGVLFEDTFNIDEQATKPEPTDTVQAIFSPTDTFKLHSKPGATNVIYIDFDGHTFSNTAWSPSTIVARSFDTDGNAAVFSNAELSQIAEIWHRVAEDFAPFDTDITTEEPSDFGPTTGRVLITHNRQVSGQLMPYPNGGGAAYSNVWGDANYASYFSPALVYYNNLASIASYIAEAASHEMGHNLGLSHDGTPTKDYYTGHGTGFVSWAPIMGASYYRHVTQWSKGEYNRASSQQDDIQIIKSHLGSRLDDHGDDILNPSTLLVDAQGNISSTSPETDPFNTDTENKGIIEDSNDIDFFVFDANAGPLDITVTPAWDSYYNSARRGANLDVKIELFDKNGVLITSNDTSNDTDAQITTTLATTGQYLLAISGVGSSTSPYSDYGSLGQYFISGKVEPFVETDNTPPSPNPMSWAALPSGQSRTSISMQATTATDASGGIQYNFTCTSASNCNDSGWQTSNQYTATNLSPNVNYSFQVTAKDAHDNTTQPAPAASSTTLPNTPPTTTNSSVTTPEDTSLEIDLVSKSSDADADTLTFSTQSAANGTVSNNNGIVTYTPNNGFSGLDSFNYTVSDGFGGTASGTVSITVVHVNNPPVASAFAPAEGESLIVNFSSAGSYDPDTNDTLSYLWDFGDGSSSTRENPIHRYSAYGDYNISLTVTDNHNSSDSSDISITITEPLEWDFWIFFRRFFG